MTLLFACSPGLSRAGNTGREPAFLERIHLALFAETIEFSSTSIEPRSRQQMMDKTRNDGNLSLFFTCSRCAALTQQMEGVQKKCCVTAAHLQRGREVDNKVHLQGLHQVLLLQQGIEKKDEILRAMFMVMRALRGRRLDRRPQRRT